MSEVIQLDEATVSMLQTIRRANSGIKGCVEILNEHGSNGGSLPVSIGPWICLAPNQEMGLLLAIEACSRRISDLFDGPFEDMGVNWNDDWMPDLGREAEAVNQLTRHEIDFDQFKEKMGMDPSIQ